jgi:methionyl-tRNA synthetase
LTYYITTPLFYVNDLPHIGSAYPTIVCDFLAGHMKQRGEDVCFLTGTDEHGQKIEKSALENNKTPQEHCDKYALEFKKLWDVLDINYDYFVRTTDQSHKDFVTEFFTKVQASGDIYKGQYTGLYCVHCEDFWLEKDLEQDPGTEKFLCPTHKKPVEEYAQENYFFKLTKYQDQLKKYIEANPDFIAPDYRKNEVMGWIKDGLRDFPISRANLEWGIKIPGDTQVIYVWFDALLGYVSGLGDKKDTYWKENSITHIIGKDILRFHAVYLPAMLMSAGMPLPKKVFGHGFLTKDGMKMGKTLGNVIDPIELSEKYGAESVKYYFLRDIVFGRDGDYTDEGFVQVLNSDLANNLGNLLSRSLKLISKYFDNKLPKKLVNAEIETALLKLQKTFSKNIDEINPFVAFQDVFKVLDKANFFINEVAPWKLLKKEDITEQEKNLAIESLYTAVVCCYQAAFYLAPVMPNLTKNLIANLGIIKEDQEFTRDQLLKEVFNFKNLDFDFTGHQLSESPVTIFQRILVPSGEKAVA